MTAAMRKRIEKAEALLIRPAPLFTGAVLLAKPTEQAGFGPWAEYERAMAEARQAGKLAIVLVPVRANPKSPSLRGSHHEHNTSQASPAPGKPAG